VVYHGEDGEKTFPGGFRPDFLNETRKIIVEFNGDYWHCNPATWGADDYNKAIKMLAKDKWVYDEGRYKVFRSFGYKVIVIWESEWLTSSDECITKVLEDMI